MHERLIAFIEEEFLTEPGTTITGDTRLISSGMIDSFSLVSLQVFIEKEFGKTIPAPAITRESFDTVNKMVEVIRQF
jgi:acyl carrier protein